MTPRTVDAGPLIRGICDQLGIASVINAMVHWDPVRAKLSPGNLICALIICCFFRQHPLYKVGLVFEVTDCELLVGQGVKPEDLNDDALGRALDKLAAADPKRIFGAICSRAAVIEEVDRRFLHWDSTSRSFYGEYDRPAGDGVQVVHGHSKDHRPDLKQILLSLLTNREGFPLWGEVHSGNESDKKLNTEVIARIRETFGPEELRSLIHVADSAFVTNTNLAAAAEIDLRFISRLPETYGAAGEVKARAWAGEWAEVGAVAMRRDATTYQASEQEAEIDGRPYRLVVYRSSHLEKRKAATFEKELTRERAELDKAADTLARQEFACAADAETAAGTWLLQKGYHLFGAEVVSEEIPLKRQRPGRPRKDEKVATRTVWRVKAVVEGRDEEKVAIERHRRSAFTLITTVPKEELDARGLLEEYKFQGSIERRFAFAKDPEIVDAFFVKKPERVMALGYVLLMVCLVFSVLERRVRNTGEPLPTMARGLLKNPTGTEILGNMFAVVTEFDDGTRQLHVPRGFQPTFAAVLRATRLNTDVYTQPPPRRSA